MYDIGRLAGEWTLDVELLIIQSGEDVACIDVGVYQAFGSTARPGAWVRMGVSLLERCHLRVEGCL